LGERSIADRRIAVWADEIRRSARFRTLYPNNNLWHFVDIPVSADQLDPQRDCRNNDCVSARIGLFQKVLADRTVEREKRREALMFLVHFVGDLHQPLHCAERNGDRGGNLLKVTYLEDDDEGLNLH